MADDRLVVQIDGRDNLSGELKKIESGVIRFVGAVSSALTALTAIGFPVVSAARFQKELLAAAKTTGYARDEVTALSEGLTDLSKQVNVSAVDLAKIATMGGQIGIGGDGNVGALVEFSASIATAVSSLDISAEAAVESMGKLINIFNLAPAEFNKVVSSLTAVSVASTANAENLFDVVRRIGNLGGSVTLPQAAALSASMIDMGLTAETAGTTITKIFADMKSRASEFANVALKGNAKAGESTDALRFSTQEWIDLVATDGLAALKAYVTGLNALGASQAAATKSDLTGQGRLFEAVTKIQQQQLRQNRIAEQAAASEQRIADAKAGNITLTEDQVLAEQKRASALRAMATEANVIDRLVEKANSAFDTGDAGAKAQQTVLAGVIAQWQLLQNNIIAAANSIGSVFIPPLTDLLRNITASLQSSGAESELKAAAKDIVEAVRQIGDAIAYVRTKFGGEGGTGFDWGAALKVATLGIALATFKGLISLLKTLGASTVVAVPGLNALGVALFGSVKSAKDAADGLNRTGDAAVRTGGILRNLSGQVAEGATAIAIQSQKLVQARASLERATAFRGGQLGAAQQALAASMQQLSRVAPTVAVGQQRIADWQTRLIARQADYAAAVARGDAAAAKSALNSVRGTQGQINRLNGLLAVVARNEQAVSRLQSRLTLLNALSSANQLKLGTVSATAELDNFLASAKAKIAAFRAGVASGGILGGVTAALQKIPDPNFIGPQISSARLTARSVLDFAAIRTAIGQTILSITGLTAAWDIAATRTAKANVILAASFSMVAKAVGGLWTALSRLTTVVFFAVMIADILKMFGLFDKLVKLIQKLSAAVGIPKDSLPQFLQTAEDLEKAAKASERLAQSTATARAEAAKFGAEQKANLAILQNKETVEIDFKFNADDPGAALAASKSALATVATAYSAVSVAVDRLAVAKAREKEAEAASVLANKALQKSLTENKDKYDKLAKATADYNNAKNDKSVSPDRLRIFETAQKSAKADVDAYEKLLGGLRRAASEAAGDLSVAAASIKANTDIISGTGGTIEEPFKGVDTAIYNVSRALFTAADAQKLLQKNTENGLSPLQEYVEMLAAERKAAKEVADITKEMEAPRADTSGSVTAEQLKLTESLQVATQRHAELAAATKNTERTIIGLSSNAAVAREILSTLTSTQDIDAMRQTAAGLSIIDASLDELGKFKGLAIPKVQPTDLMDAAATVVVKTKLKDMYSTWADMAKTEADRAKNYASQALGEMQKMARDTQAFITKLTQNGVNAATKAKNQKLDRTDDAASRQRMRDIQTEYDTERALLEEYLAAQRSGYVTQSEMHAAEAQALFELEEKYNKIKLIEEDRLNIQKQRRNANDEVAQMDKLLQKVEYYKKRVEEANRTLGDPSASLKDKAGAVAQRQDGLDKLKATYSQVEVIAERLSNIDPIGGELVVDPATMEKVKKSVTDVSDALGALTVENVEKIEPVFNALAANYGNAAQAMGRDAETAKLAFSAFAGGAENLAAVSAQMASLIAQSPALESSMKQLQDVMRDGLVSPASIDVKDINKLADQIKGTLASIRIAPQPIDLTVDEARVATSIARSIANGVAQSDGKTVAPITVQASDASLKQMQNDIEGKVQPNVELTFRTPNGTERGQLNAVSIPVTPSPESLAGMSTEITNNVTAEINLTGKLTALKDESGTIVWGKVGGRARGGLIGDVVALSQGISRFATGGGVGKAVGSITGPGTGTSDSILSWLSNGEYVIDALTTSTFGADFFRKLQEMARGGYSMPFLRKARLPAFNMGGGVALPDTGLAGIAPSGVVSISVTLNGKKSSLYAERTEASKFVESLKAMES